MHTSPVRRYIINNLSNHQKDIIKMVVRKFGLSRQAALRHMYVLVTDGKVTVNGKTKDRIYQLKPLVKKTFSFPITSNLTEDKLFNQTINPQLENLEKNILEICEFGFSEIMNNVLSYSESENCKIYFKKNVGNISIKIEDDGVGIFKKLLDHFSLENEYHSILELSKGKITTDPVHHAGEGIYFVSRLFDKFCMESEGLSWTHNLEKDQWMVVKGGKKRGTSVILEINPFSKTTLKGVINSYSTNGRLIFDRTCVPVSLSKLDSECLLSRSQAKRLTQNLVKFKNICFDFNGLKMIGHSFADEIFRVFQHENPNQKLEWKNSNIELDELFSSMQQQNKK